MKESGEMYLKEIYLLKKNNEIIRSIDVANKRSVSKPSVSRAMSMLKDKKYIMIDNDGIISLTDTGVSYAKELDGKFNTIYTYLKNFLDMPDCIAKRNACKMEHDISDALLNAMENKIKEEV